MSTGNGTKVAIIHDWCVIYGGAERVLEHIIDCYPDADIFSLIDKVPADQRHFLRGKKVHTSFLQKIPGIELHYRKLLGLMPYAIEQFDLSGYDLVISSSYCVAKGVLTGPNQLHVSYCHSPMRYAWDHYHEYLSEMSLGGLAGLYAKRTLHKIRDWDVRSSNTVDAFIANSGFVQARIRKFYRRDSTIVFPPVETGIFTMNPVKSDTYVTAGRFVPFKRLDLAVDAFTAMPDRKLVVIGDGPEMARLRAKAGPNVHFPGFLPPDQVAKYLGGARAFIFPSEEDFGIVPVEAQATGTPVIAYGSGGALETVVGVNTVDRGGRPPTGVFFDQQTPQALAHAVRYFEANAHQFDPVKISEHASGFSAASFKERLVLEVDAARARRAYRPRRCRRIEPLVAVNG
ncbi:MAG: glycosyltransferase family 4 protein [Pseudomonadota bacterium]